MPYKRKRGQVKEEKTYQKRYSSAKDKRWVIWERTNSYGIADSESCLHDMKRRLRTTLDWCIYHEVSLIIER